jgi:hypothetical protein
MNLFLYGIINIAVWYLVPAWGENFLWLTGSCFYVWPIVIILLFLVPLRKKQINPEYKLALPIALLYFFLGILAGLSYENVTAGLFMLIAAYSVVKGIKKEKFTLFEVLGIIGFLLGFIVLIAAPGNYSRLNSYEVVQSSGIIYQLFHGFYITTNIFMKYGLLLTGFCVMICFELQRHGHKKVNCFSYLYLIAGIFSAYSMVLSPVFIERVFYPVSIFLIIALFSLLYQVQFPEIITRNKRIFTIVLLLFFTFSLVKAGIAIKKVYNQEDYVNIYEKHYGQVS